MPPSPRWPEPGRDGTGVDFDALVDRIVESHRAVLATLEHDARPERAAAQAQERALARRERSRFARLEEDAVFARHRHDAERLRRDRQRIARGLQPTEAAPRYDPPLVTRGGILYVPPVFEHATGLDEVAAARLFHAGLRSIDAFLRAPSEELATVLRLPVQVVDLAKHDLDLTRLPHVDAAAADFLRLLGYCSVSRLVIADPELLGREAQRVASRHRLLRVPEVLSSAAGLRRLIAAAEAHAG